MLYLVEFVLFGYDCIQVVILECGSVVVGFVMKLVMLEGYLCQWIIDLVEIVQIGFVVFVLVYEFDIQFEGFIGFGEEFIFVDVQCFVEDFDLGNGCFVDVYSVDVVGFYEMDLCEIVVIF